MKPPFPYYGGKQRIAGKIVDLLPEHEHYVEPFFGGGSVLLSKPISRHETVNDADGRIVNFWKVLRDSPFDLERVCTFTPHAKDEIMLAREVSDDPLEDARRVFVMLTQGRSARTDGATGWRFVVDPSNPTPFPRFLAGYNDRLRSVAERLSGVSIEHGDALDVMARYGKHEGVLLYLDPPYMDETRYTKAYAVENGSHDFHAEMLLLADSLPCSVVLSGYASELYDGFLSGWERYEISARSNQSNRTEIVWVKGEAGDPSTVD